MDPIDGDEALEALGFTPAEIRRMNRDLRRGRPSRVRTFWQVFWTGFGQGVAVAVAVLLTIAVLLGLVALVVTLWRVIT